MEYLGIYARGQSHRLDNFGSTKSRLLTKKQHSYATFFLFPSGLHLTFFVVALNHEQGFSSQDHLDHKQCVWYLCLMT
jgi:hypothetical protein